MPAPSPLDRALLTRLYTLPTTDLSELLASLSKDPIESAPATLFDLTEWALSDEIRPWIEAREVQLAAPLKRKHLANLDTLALDSPNPAERRRASTTILRILTAPAGTPFQSRTPLRGGTPLRGVRNSPTPLPTPHSPSSPPGGGAALRGGGGSSSTPPTHSPPHPFTHSPTHPFTPPFPQEPPTHTPESTPSPSPPPSPLPTPHSPFPTPSPDPVRSAQDLIDLILLAIRQPNNPERNTGPLTLFTLSGRANPAELPEFRSNYLANMLRNCWEFRASAQRSLRIRTAAERKADYPDAPSCHTEDQALALIDLTLKDHSTRILHLDLRRPLAGPHKDCWILSHLTAATRLLRFAADPKEDSS